MNESESFVKVRDALRRRGAGAAGSVWRMGAKAVTDLRGCEVLPMALIRGYEKPAKEA